MRKWPHDLKLRWASKHFQQLEMQIRGWEEGQGYTLHVEPNPHPPNYIVRAELERPAEDEPFALTLGDFLHNARASLDYIAGELGDIGAGGVMSEKDALATMFPITSSADRFAEVVQRRLPTVPQPVRAVIEDLQPYKTGGDLWEFEPLWILNELARFDRHRFPHFGYERAGMLALNPETSPNVRITDMRVEDTRFDILEAEAAEDIEAIQGGETRAVLATFTAVPIDPQQEMHMDFEGAIEIVFDPERLPNTLSLASDMSIISILWPIPREIRKVFTALAPFLPAEPPLW